MKIIQFSILCSFIFIGSFQMAFAHGDLDERILKVSEEIKIAPDSSYLYFKRGRLYFQHEDYEKAIEDMHAANELGFQDLHCDLIFAKSNQKLLNYEASLLYLDKIDKKNPNHVIALKTRADIYFQQQKYKASAVHYEKVIDFAIKATPENYLLAHESWAKCHTIEGDDKASEILEKGIKQLGPVFTLLDKQLSFYVARMDYKKALLIQEKIIDSSNRKETAYYNAAQICGHAEEETMKKRYLNSSLHAIYQLSPQKQQDKAMRMLRVDIESELRQMSKGGSQSE